MSGLGFIQIRFNGKCLKCGKDITDYFVTVNRKNEQKAKQEREEEIKRSIERRWSYLENLPSSEKYDVSLGRYMTREDIKAFFRVGN